MDGYAHAVSRTIIRLEDCKVILIDCLFELAIRGELKEWADMVEIGEDYYFSKELYESLEDSNVQTLLKIINQIDCALD